VEVLSFSPSFILDWQLFWQHRVMEATMSNPLIRVEKIRQEGSRNGASVSYNTNQINNIIIENFGFQEEFGLIPLGELYHGARQVTYLLRFFIDPGNF
jgi:hypothetical protein